MSDDHGKGEIPQSATLLRFPGRAVVRHADYDVHDACDLVTEQLLQQFGHAIDALDQFGAAFENLALSGANVDGIRVNDLPMTRFVAERLRPELEYFRTALDYRRALREYATGKRTDTDANALAAAWDNLDAAGANAGHLDDFDADPKKR